MVVSHDDSPGNRKNTVYIDEVAPGEHNLGGSRSRYLYEVVNALRHITCEREDLKNALLRERERDRR